MLNKYTHIKLYKKIYTIMVISSYNQKRNHNHTLTDTEKPTYIFIQTNKKTTKNDHKHKSNKQKH